MALQFRDIRTSTVRTVEEPEEIRAQWPDNPAHGDWLAMHQRRTIQRMDESRRWQRVYQAPPSTSGVNVSTGPADVPSEATSTPRSAGAATQPAPEPEPESVPAQRDPSERPAINDVKDVWVDWAVTAHGYDREEAQSLTKDQLQSLE